MEENKTISDENLLKFFSKENLEDMTTLFCNGRFQDLLTKYFYINNSNEAQNNQNLNNTPKEEEINNQLSSLIVTNNDNNKLELNYQIFEKLLEDELNQQIVFTIVLYCLLKNKKMIKEVHDLLEKYKYPIEDMIFPLNFLIIKYYIKIQNFLQAINNINTLISKYEEYKMNIEEKKLDLNNIYTIETFHQKFTYFDNLFNYLFNMNNIDAKIKKLYFELKSCFYQKKCFSQAYKIILDLYQKYPEDFLIQFELAKDSIICSKPDVYETILETMKKSKEEEKDEYLRGVYNNYILYAEALSQIAYNKFTEAKTKFEQIVKIREKENNVILQNNIALLSIYENNLKEGYDKLVSLFKDKASDNKNEKIRENIKIIQEKFNIK